MLLLLISFIGGVLTVLAPCILPLLPVIIGGSLSDAGIQRKKAFVIVGSLAVSVIAFTLLLKASTLFIDIPPYVWQFISGGIVLGLGIITLFPSLWESGAMNTLNVKSQKFLGTGLKKNSFWGDVIIGAALGPVFSSCSPTYFIVLATVLPASPILGFVYLVSYALGLSLMLLLIALVGQRIVGSLNIAANPKGVFKQVLGILFIIVGVGILFGVDKKIQSAVVGAGFFDITKVEQTLLRLNK
ncbi:MAG: sulfite exporter TauE/SafE family protein [Candidatus Zambryskibacteria bacterium]|nr:sulfite exporter TauE/SafE family protein [Candidatus Zambryskibacteria bacterium]